MDLFQRAIHRHINLAAKKAGFAVAKRRPGNRGPDGQYRRYDLICVEAKDHHKEVDTAKESRSVKKDCLWKAKAVFYVAFNAWKFVVMHGTHSHRLDPKGAGYIAGHRRRERTAAVIEAILKYSASTENTSTDIVRMIKKDFEGINIKPRDVIDVIHGHKVAKAGPLTPTQQFIHHLTTTPSIYCNIYRQNDVADGRIERVFWTYNWCIEQWKQNPELMIIDCTYKVNKFDMPLLQIVGVTCMHTTFNLGYCLVSGEKEATFRWVLEVLNSLIQSHQIARPQVIITDYDKALKRALRAVFNDSQHQLCIWHIMKNVAFNTKRKWVGSLDGTVLGDQGSDGSHLREDDEVDDSFINPATSDEVARRAGTRLLHEEVRAFHLNKAIRNAHLRQLNGRAPQGSGRQWLNNADGILHA
jgi:hypothetical protein